MKLSALPLFIFYQQPYTTANNWSSIINYDQYMSLLYLFLFLSWQILRVFTFVLKTFHWCARVRKRITQYFGYFHKVYANRYKNPKTRVRPLRRHWSRTKRQNVLSTNNETVPFSRDVCSKSAPLYARPMIVSSVNNMCANSNYFSFSYRRRPETRNRL